MDVATTTNVFLAIVTGLAFVLWTLFWNTKKTVEHLVADLSAYKLHVAETYVTSNALDKAMVALSKVLDNFQDQVFKRLDKFEIRLESKQKEEE